MSLLNFFRNLFGKKSRFFLKKSQRPLGTAKSVGQELYPVVSGRILIFEDSETWSSIMKKALEKEGHTVFVSPEALKAAELVKLRRPNLVLMDINMPGISGFEATRSIKSRPENQKLPILILTGQNTPFDRMESMKQGARAYICKEQPLEDIVIAINAYMRNPALKSDISGIIHAQRAINKPHKT